jgi:hypothetical protein
MQDQVKPTKKFLVTCTTIIEGTTEEEAHANAGFNHYSSN